MHELSVTESILEISLRHLPPGEPARITALHLVIGQLSSLVDDSVQFYWDFIAKGTPAEGAELVFRRIPAELQCQDCQHRYQPGANELSCPNCGSLNIRVVAGEEFYVESMDIEKVEV